MPTRPSSPSWGGRASSTWRHDLMSTTTPPPPPATPPPSPSSAASSMPAAVSRSWQVGGLRSLGLFLLPILALVGVIALFLSTGTAGLAVTPAVPVEAVRFERTVLRPGVIEIHVQNTS